MSTSHKLKSDLSFNVIHKPFSVQIFYFGISQKVSSCKYILEKKNPSSLAEVMNRRNNPKITLFNVYSRLDKMKGIEAGFMLP